MHETTTTGSPSAQPVSAPEVEAELRKILASQRFLKAEGLRKFLTFIVEKTLAGHGAELKESVVAMEAFKRRSSFDPRLDAFVRVQAGRLRAALAEYYQTEGSGDAVVLEVPKGSYTPTFSAREGWKPEERNVRRVSRGLLLTYFVVPICVLAAVLWAIHARYPWTGSKSRTPFTARDLIVVADFDNTTGDPVFDGTIKQALLVDLEQSAFLNILPESQVQETRRLMAYPPGGSLTGEMARELCQRAGGTAVLSGSIANMGLLYVIGMTTTSCATGEVIIRQQVRAAGKEQVLPSLDKAASELRAKLGESLANLQKYSTPLEQVTTPSLKALQAYGEGISVRNTQGDVESVPYFQRAIELDPTFAMAYNRLGVVYFDVMQLDLAAAKFRKAFALREHVSQRERYYIESRYYHFVTGELDKALAVYEDWRRDFPHDSVPSTGCGMIHSAYGDYESSIAEHREALRRNPNLAYNYTNLAEALLNLDRRQEARAVLSDMQSHRLQVVDQYLIEYQLAFLEGNTAEMQRQASLAAAKPGAAEILFLFQAQTEAGQGRLGETRRLIHKAVELATAVHENESAAAWQAQGALFEAEFGNRRQAAEQADSALRLSPGKDIRVLAALALARAGDAKRAQMLAATLKQEFPLDAILNEYWLPTVEGAAQLSEGAPLRALEHFEIARHYELGQPTGFQVLAISPMYPVYLRGEAYLKAVKAAEAAGEFERILQHPGLVQNYPLGVLARLGLARAAALQPDRSRALALYGELMHLWNTADADVPIVKQARSEAAGLQQHNLK
jgi:tetratricopeptide (TPR) repeat protein